MSTTLAAEARTDTGKGVARKLRAAGQIPGVIYRAGEDAKPIAFDPIRLLEIFRKTRNANTIIDVDLDGGSVRTIVKEAQRHPVSRDLLHVDFYEVADGEALEVMVPIRAVGRPVGAQRGGRLQIIRREVKVRCTWDKIPETVDVDVSPLDVGGIILASEITPPDGVALIYKQDFNVLTLVARRGAKK